MSEVSRITLISKKSSSLSVTFSKMRSARSVSELGIPEYLVFRQPFPGPGLGIRIIGEVTAEKVRIVQDADAIYREEMQKPVSTATQPVFCALTNMRSVGVMGDERTYDYAVALRAVKTIDFMTAESADIPFEVLQTVMTRIINEVKGVNRVFYDLTSKRLERLSLNNTRTKMLSDEVLYERTMWIVAGKKGL